MMSLPSRHESDALCQLCSRPGPWPMNMHDELPELVGIWGARWGLPDLWSQIDLRFSTRLTRALGRCRPSSGRITLQASLQSSPERMIEVLCHEAAHIAVYQLFGPEVKPHGPEWHRLVQQAGFRPEVRAREPGSAGPRATPTPAILPYEHRCPVCQSVRFARRPVRSWRCAECLDAGLEGELTITRIPDSPSSP